jgi:hypothetical protein
MFTSRRLAKVVPALALLALAVPTSAFGQATRTWVSGVGDDANPCSRTAPCKTFAGAISKTAAGGEINCIDPGGFGAVTITKSLAIKCYNTLAGVLVSGTNAIVVNAAATDKVTLVGLDINGLRIPSTGTSLAGVKVISAKQVNILNDEIYGFQYGVEVVPTVTNTRVVVANSHIHENQTGVMDAPGNAAGTNAITTLRNNVITDNTSCGAAVSAFGVNAGAPSTTDCGAAPLGVVNNVAHLLAFGNGFYENGTGLLARGANTRLEIGNNDISTNGAGLARLDSGFIKSFGNNQLIDNGTTVAPNGPNDTFTKRHIAKRAVR